VGEYGKWLVGDWEWMNGNLALNVEVLGDFVGIL
jgi:hypothetical protein